MQAQASQSPQDAEALTQAAVLEFLLNEHPSQLTVAEVVRQIARDDSFAECDSVRRAIRDLTGAGLLHRQGDFALPSRAALYFAGLPTI